MKAAQREIPEPPVHLAFVAVPYVNLPWTRSTCMHMHVQPMCAAVSAHSLHSLPGTRLLAAREKLTAMAGIFHQRRSGGGTRNVQALFREHACACAYGTRHRRVPSSRIPCSHMCEKQSKKGWGDGYGDVGSNSNNLKHSDQHKAKPNEIIGREGERGFGLGKLSDTMQELWRRAVRDVDVRLVLTDVAIVFAFFFALGAFDSAVAEGPQRCVPLNVKRQRTTNVKALH